MKYHLGVIVGILISFGAVCLLSVFAPNVFTQIANWFIK